MKDKKRYQILLHGCDDSTYINVELTKKQAKFIKRIGKLSETASTYACMPTLEIERIGN